MRKSRAAVVLAAGAILLLSSASCLEPTEITLDVSTDAPCNDAKGVTFRGGASIGVEDAVPNATSTHCEGGDLGTLVGAPSDKKDAEAFFVVALGVDRPVSECTPANHYKGCIVQRRSLRYVKHKPIRLPIKMWLVCKDKECDRASTCARNGKCVPAAIPDPESCPNGACYPAGDSPADFPDGDSGLSDATSEKDGNGEGGPIGDGSTSRDADADAPVVVVPPPPPDGTLFCPPVLAGCSASSTCCWDRGGEGGRCGPQNSCQQTEIPLNCTRKSDCPQPDNYCCGLVIGQIGMGMMMSYGPRGFNAADANSDGRTLTNSMCEPQALLCSTWICSSPADCPASVPVCNKSSNLFMPTGIFGECTP